MKRSYDVGGFVLNVTSDRARYLTVLDRYCGSETLVRNAVIPGLKITLHLKSSFVPKALPKASSEQFCFENSLICIKTLTITSYCSRLDFSDQPGLILRPVWSLLFYLGFFPLHAGLVSYEGRAIAIVGPSGTGKSTLSLAMAERGCEFICDDHLFIREEKEGLLAVPFVKRVRIKGGQGDLGGRPLNPLPMTTRRALDLNQITVLFPQYDPNSPPAVTPLSLVEGMVKLMKDNMVIEAGQLDNRASQVKMLDVLGKVLNEGKIFKLSYNDPDLFIACDRFLTFLRQQAS